MRVRDSVVCPPLQVHRDAPPPGLDHQIGSAPGSDEAVERVVARVVPDSVEEAFGVQAQAQVAVMDEHALFAYSGPATLRSPVGSISPRRHCR